MLSGGGGLEGAVNAGAATPGGGSCLFVLVGQTSRWHHREWHGGGGSRMGSYRLTLFEWCPGVRGMARSLNHPCGSSSWIVMDVRTMTLDLSAMAVGCGRTFGVS